MSETRQTEEFAGGITDEDDCPYLPGRKWRNLVVNPGPKLDKRTHQSLLDQGFRRIAHAMFRPICRSCQECRPLRIDVRRFRPSQSQRRASRRNRDVDVRIMPVAFSEERRLLLEKYLGARHVGPMTADETTVRQFMYDAPLETVCIDYRRFGRLIGSGLVDLLDDITSSVYFFFDPEESRRSLGVYSMLREIALARELGHRWHHPGFNVAGCDAMNYKVRFEPCEMMGTDGKWVPVGDGRIETPAADPGLGMFSVQGGPSSTVP